MTTISLKVDNVFLLFILQIELLYLIMSKFIHLHLHSEYSIIDGIVRIKPLMQQCREMRMPAVAVTDFCNFFAAVKAYTQAINNGIKPILGSELPIGSVADNTITSRMVFLCQNELGYKNLTKLISRAYLEGQVNDLVIVDAAWLDTCHEGLIVLSGGIHSDIAKALSNDNIPLAKHHLTHWKTLFSDRFYIEITRTARPEEDKYIQQVLPLAETMQLPIVATNDVRFMKMSDFDAHETRVCIYGGHLLEDSTRPQIYSKEQYLKTPEQMADLFSDLPMAIENSFEIAKRCSATIELGKNYLPNFPTPEGQTIDIFLQSESEKGLNNRLSIILKGLDEEAFQLQRQAYDERLAFELNVINTMGFPGYFLIVADFIRWAKNNDVPVGPGRGSGAGSLVAYALDITDLDPLEYDLLFERFLNPERVSMPDFDIDFCMEGRDKVIDYVARTYGRYSVSQIITFGSMAAKAVVRDVGRVLGHPYGFIDKISKLIPFEIGITLSSALEQEEQLKARYDSESDVFELIELAKKLEGITRNVGKHAGGVVIAPSELTDFTAIYCEAGSQQIVSQFDKDDVESAGLVKFDFLGLRTLTIIDWAIKSVKLSQNISVDIALIPLDSPESFDLLKACQTTAVFQLESRGMKDLIHRLQPDCFEDIIALVALFRPGPLQSGMVDDFIDRKHGRAQVEYPHPDLEPILKPTYGVILYQEQVMQIAQVLANYTLGAADMLRRAMGKKKPEEMAKQREIFTKGAVERDVEEETATYIFDLMEKFAGYGFNKSHSAAYALVAYQTAWLKANYPADFMASVLSSDMDNTDKIVNFIDECYQMKLTVLPPSINHSQYKFIASTSGEIRYGLGAIKGAGEAAIELICEARKEKGPFKSLFDFCQRVEIRKVNRRVLEALIKAGALDDFSVSRADLFISIDKALKLAGKTQVNLSTGQHDLFSDDNDDNEYLNTEDWSLIKTLEAERETLGLYFSGHPVDQYKAEMSTFVKTRIRHLSPSLKKNVLILGLVIGVRRIVTKRGKKMAILTIDDNTMRIDIAIFQELLELYEPLLIKDVVLVVDGEISNDEFNGGIKMAAKKVMTMEQAREFYNKHLRLTLSHKDQAKIPLIKALLTAHAGDIPILITYTNQALTLTIKISTHYNVSLNDELIYQLKKLLGLEAVNLV